MLLLSLRRGPGAQLTMCPLLWLGVVLSLPGLLILPILGWQASQTGSGVLWSLLVMSAFFLSIFGYAFYRAALGQQVRCRRQDARLLVSSHTEQVEAPAAAVLLVVAKKSVGGTRPITVYDVTLLSPGCWRSSFLLHRGLTWFGAVRAAERLREHLGVRLEAPQVK